jgi:hypothetical protein
LGWRRRAEGDRGGIVAEGEERRRRGGELDEGFADGKHREAKYSHSESSVQLPAPLHVKALCLYAFSTQAADDSGARPLL